MTKTELEKQLNNDKQYKEIWLNGPNEQRICALINGNVGCLMYLRFKGDAGYSSRNPSKPSEKNIEIPFKWSV